MRLSCGFGRMHPLAFTGVLPVFLKPKMKRSTTPLIDCGASLRRLFGRTFRRSALALALASAAQLQADPPELKTQGNQIVVKATGAPVRLTGVNIPSLDWGNGENIMTSLEVAVGTWKANVIRLPVKGARWFDSNHASYRATIDAFIARASELNVHVILDLHEYKKALHADAAFWTDAAARYKNNPAVLFGLLNEPHGITWPVWHTGDSEGPGIQGLLDAVRATGANNIALAGGLEYAYTLTGILEDYALTDTSSGNGVVYDAHIYPWKTYIQDKVGTVGQTYPILIGEFGHPGGTYDAKHGSFAPPETWLPNWLNWIDTHGFHWTAWCFHHTSSPRMLTDWSYAPTSYWGTYAKERLQSYADPDVRRVVGGTVIGTTGTKSNPNSGVLTAWQSGAVAAFGGSPDTYFDAPTASGSWTGLDLVTPRRITQISYMPRKNYGNLMVQGVFEGSNSATFSSGVVTLHTVSTAPNASGGVYTTVAVSNTGTYRYVRYRGPANSYCNVASILFYTGTNSAPNVAEDVHVVDNGGTGCTITGTWSNSSVGGYHGTASVTDGNTGKGTKSMRFTPTLNRAGLYEVFARWSAHSGRTTKAPYDINYSGGTALVEVNQRVNGATWYSLGTFYFDAGTTGNVLLRTNGTTDGHVSADGMMFRRVADLPVTEVIVDAGNPADSAYVTVNGAWVTSTLTSGYHGADYLHDNNTGHGTKSVTFTPNLPVTGTYDVYLIWTSATSRANNVPVSIVHAGGTDGKTVNQRTYGGQWRLVGTYTFNAGTGGSVTLSNTGTNGYVIADAVLFDLH